MNDRRLIRADQRRGCAPAGSTTSTECDQTQGSPALILEGESYDPAIGAFRGHAIASVSTEEDGQRVETLYLVDVPERERPVWVRASEIRRRSRADRSEPAAAQHGDSPAGAVRPVDREAVEVSGT